MEKLNSVACINILACIAGSYVGSITKPPNLVVHCWGLESFSPLAGFFGVLVVTTIVKP